MRRWILLCSIVCASSLLACEKASPPRDAEPVEPTPARASAPAAPAKPAAPEPKEERPAQPDASSMQAQMDAARGQACAGDPYCPGYLRCIERACAVPPAITGEHDASTPRVTFSAPDGSPVASFHIELATNDPQRMRGLMFRREMKDDWGMLFIYPDDRPLSFWMKNTYIPLDMVFIDSRGEVLGMIEGAEPLTLSPRTIGKPGRYVLELNAGVARKRGIAPGQIMALENVARDDFKPSR